MQTPPSVPHGSWLEVLPYIIFSFLAGSLGWVKVWLDRKKPDAEVHESVARTARTNAEARKIEAEASRDIGEVVMAMSGKITEVIQLYHDQTKQVEFLQRQVEDKTQDEKTARDVSHRALNEVQRCNMRIRDYEELLRNANPTISFEAFEFKTNEQIRSER